MTTKIKSGVISDNAITSAHISSGAISSAHLTSIDTDNITEGSSNLYFTTARVDSHLSGGTGVTYSSGAISIGQSVATTDSPTFANLTLTGNLNITGDVDSVSVTDLDVKDKTITVGVGGTASANDGAGLVVDGASASILWDNSNGEWDINKPINVTGTISSTNLTTGATSVFQNGTYDKLHIQTQSAGGGVIAFVTNNAGNAYEPLKIDFETLDLRVSGTPKLSIDSSGNVGIGTDNPGFNLDVTGLLRVTNDVYLQGDVYVNSKIRHNGDVDNYISFSAADTQSFVTGNSTRLQITNSLVRLNQEGLNQDFQIFGENNDNLFYVDASTDRVGIGISDPSAPLHIQTNDSTTNSTVTSLIITNLSTGTTTTGFGGEIRFQAERNNGVNQNTGGIRSIAEVNSGSNISSGMAFDTSAAGVNSEKMRIDYEGNVGIGTINPTEKLHVEGSVLIDAFNMGDEEGIFFREGFSSSNKYNVSIMAKDHNGASADGLSINGYDGISFCTGSNSRNEVVRITGGSSGVGKILIGDTQSHTDDLLQIETPASGGGHGIQIRRNDSNNDQGIGHIQFGNNTDTDLAKIAAMTDGSTDNARLTFHTQPNGGSLTERMRIGNTGEVGIGLGGSNPQGRLEIRVPEGEGGFMIGSSSSTANQNKTQMLQCASTLSGSNVWKDVAYLGHSGTFRILGKSIQSGSTVYGGASADVTLSLQYGSASVTGHHYQYQAMNGGDVTGNMEYRYLNSGATNGNYRLQVRMPYSGGTHIVYTSITGISHDEIYEDDS